MFKKFTFLPILCCICWTSNLVGQDTAKAIVQASRQDSFTTTPFFWPLFPNDTLITFINTLSCQVNEQALTGRGRAQLQQTPSFTGFAATHRMSPTQVQALLQSWAHIDSVKTNPSSLLQGARLYCLRQLEASAQQYSQAALDQEGVLPSGLSGADWRDTSISEAIAATSTAWLLAGNSANEHGDHIQAIRFYRRADSLLSFGRMDQLPAAMVRQKKLLGELLSATLYEEGKKIGDTDGYVMLAQAASIEQTLLKEYNRARQPKEWARIQSNLGMLLQAQGEIVEQSDSLYQLSLAAFKAALEIYTRAEWPLDWARLQNNIGVVLSKQGNIEEAIEAFRSALEVYTPRDHSEDWALNQYNLGNMLQYKATEPGRTDGHELLQQSVAAYRQALTIFTAQANPDEWGWVQHKMGVTLFQQGRTTPGRTSFAEAVTAFRAALSVRTKEGSPAAWANTQFNLGTTLWEESGRAVGDNVQLLDAAIEAFEAALTIYTQKNYPDQWFNTLKNLGLLYEQKQQWAAAIRHFEKLREVEPLYAAQKVNELRKKAGQ